VGYLALMAEMNTDFLSGTPLVRDDAEDLGVGGK
jgi:hypothetical protein